MDSEGPKGRCCCCYEDNQYKVKFDRVLLMAARYEGLVSVKKGKTHVQKFWREKEKAKTKKSKKADDDEYEEHEFVLVLKKLIEILHQRRLICSTKRTITSHRDGF